MRDTMTIQHAHGEAIVRKALVGIRDRLKIEVEGGADMHAHGNLIDHEYKIEQDGKTIATVSKKWFRIKETYGVEIQPDQDDALLLAVTVCINAMT